MAAHAIKLRDNALIAADPIIYGFLRRPFIGIVSVINANTGLASQGANDSPMAAEAANWLMWNEDFNVYNNGICIPLSTPSTNEQYRIRKALGESPAKYKGASNDPPVSSW
jgi:hypothetical protein